MLIDSNRLAKTRDFNLLVKRGQFVRGSFLDLKYLKLNQIQNYFPKQENAENFKKQLKLAISISTKISKSAVVRNRLKRQLKEAARPFVAGGKIKNGYYLLFIAKPSILEKNFADISQEIKLLFNKINIFTVS